MNYFVKRDEKEYGPYTLADLQRYVQTGSISTNDLARSEAIEGFVPVSQIIGNINVAAPPAAFAGSGFGAVAAPAYGFAPVSTFVDPAKEPPSLHWGLLLFLGIISLSLLGSLWLFYLSIWVRKLRPNADAIWYLLGWMAGFAGTVVFQGREFAGFLNIGAGVALIIGAFRIRAVLEDYYNSDEPMALSLSGVMTFFFSPYYFQYHLNEISQRRKAAQTSMAGAL